jgi:hypothetical protein
MVETWLKTHELSSGINRKQNHITPLQLAIDLNYINIV